MSRIGCVKRWLALTLAAQVAGGCSWVFQERLPSNYSGKYPPRCSTSKGLVALDGVFAVLNGLTAGAELTNTARTDQDDALLIGSLAWTLVHTGSALSGSRWADHCRDAQDAWDKDDGEERRDLLLHRAQLQRQLEKSSAPAPRESSPTPRAVPAPTAKPTPRGFYCASSPSLVKVGVCAREKDACVRAIGALAAAAPDVTRCTLVETAYCFDAGSGDADDVCAPTVDACSVQRERVIAAGVNAGECVETS